MKWSLFRTTTFNRHLKKWLKNHPDSAESIVSTLELLTENPFDPALRSHKLQGALKGYWSCSGGYDLRIVFKLAQLKGKEVIVLMGLGNHDQVY